MGISRITAIMIQNNDARVNTVKCEDGKYQGLIELWKEDTFHTTIVSTSKSSFDTREDAEQEMLMIINKIKDMGDKIF